VRQWNSETTGCSYQYVVLFGNTYSLWAEGVGEQGGERERGLGLRGGKEQDNSDNYIKRNFIICTSEQILLW